MRLLYTLVPLPSAPSHVLYTLFLKNYIVTFLTPLTQLYPSIYMVSFLYNKDFHLVEFHSCFPLSTSIGCAVCSVSYYDLSRGSLSSNLPFPFNQLLTN